MLLDALAAENHRFLRNRQAVAWSVLFVPIIGLVLSVFGSMFLKQKMGDITEARLPVEIEVSGSLDLGHALVNLAGDLTNPMMLLFVLIGASIIYAGDYRWETWRLISARNSRTNLILAKVGTVKLLTLAALVLLAAFGFVEEIVKGFIFERTLGFTMTGERAADIGLLTLLAYVRVVQVMMLSLLAAVVTRSLLAALFTPLVVMVAQMVLGNVIPLFGWTEADWQAQFLLPGLAYDTLKHVVLGGMDAPAANVAWMAAASLAGWCLAPLGASLAWFGRQDLSKE